MMKNEVTMVYPKQIVQKGLKGCVSSRTVTSFAQKYGVPCVWWKPNKNQKVLLVDWPTFRQTWKEVWNQQKTAAYGHGRGYSNFGTTKRSTSRTGTKSNKPWGKSSKRTYSGKTTYNKTRTYKRTRKAA